LLTPTEGTSTAPEEDEKRTVGMAACLISMKWRLSRCGVLRSRPSIPRDFSDERYSSSCSLWPSCSKRCIEAPFCTSTEWIPLMTRMMWGFCISEITTEMLAALARGGEGLGLGIS